MKRNLTITIAALMIMAVVTITAEAQASGSQLMRAHIPFAFNVGKTNLPAGEYTITVVNPSSDRKILQIRSEDGRLSALIQTSGAKSAHTDNAKLLFNRYDDTYFFAEVRMAGDSTTLAAVKTSAERTVENTIASRGRKSRVAVYAE